MFVVKIGFIGLGQMARALAIGIRKSDESVALCGWDPNSASQSQILDVIPDFEFLASNQDVVDQANLVFLAVKPQMFPAVASILAVPKQVTLVSVMAGISVHQIATDLRTKSVLRVMPNTPCLIGQGALALAESQSVAAEVVDQVAGLLQGAGKVVRCQESQLNAVTGLSGSGPAFVLEFLSALIDGGVLAGLPREMATTLAEETILGSVRLKQETGKHPAELQDQVTSPGGTTIYGLQHLREKGGNAAIAGAVLAAKSRADELGNLN
ncbi:MAG: pyrroline-5-carboxylate reductase [Pirellulaceae bacterium]